MNSKVMSWINSNSSFGIKKKNEWIPAAIAAAGGIVNSIIGSSSQNQANKTNLQIARETNEQNYKMQQEVNRTNQFINEQNNRFNRDLSIEMFNLENAFNSPQEQMRRLVGAGINPFVAAGQVGQVEGRADTIPAQSPIPAGMTPAQLPAPIQPTYDGSAISGLTGLATAFAQIAQGNKTSTENQQLQDLFDDVKRQYEADIDLKNASARAQMLNNAITIMYGFKKAKKEVDKLSEEIDNIHAATNESEGRTALLAIDSILKNIEMQLEGEKLAQFRELRPIVYKSAEQEFENKVKEGKEIDSRTRANHASAGASSAMADYYRSQKRKTVSENRYQELTNNFYERVLEVRNKIADHVKGMHNSSNQKLIGYHWNQIKGLYNELRGLAPDLAQMYNDNSMAEVQFKACLEALDRAIKDNDWYEADKVMGYTTSLVNAFKGSVNVSKPSASGNRLSSGYTVTY